MAGIGRWGSLSGLVFAVLFGVGSGIWALEQPVRSAGTGDVLAFFEGTSTEILVGGTMSLLSLVFLVWFGAILKDRLAAAVPAGSGLPLLAFAGTLLTAGVGLAAETINMAAALSAKDGQLTGSSAQLFFDLTYAFGAHAASITMAMVAFTVGICAVTTGEVVPRWAGWLAVAIGLAMLTPAILNRLAFLVLYTFAVLLTGALSVHLHRTKSEQL
jgi:hypothetical protein